MARRHHYHYLFDDTLENGQGMWDFSLSHSHKISALLSYAIKLSWLSEFWAKILECKVARSFPTRLSRRRSRELLKKNKLHLSLLVGALTDHCPIRIYAMRCTHLNIYSAIDQFRYLRSYFFPTPEELLGMGNSCLRSLVVRNEDFVYHKPFDAII